ncbi:MAG TPA: putative Ig domain-containing protein, partial [Trebonia sp.]|nr:putative Ig domain-containing protein [Trebonia sp.]
MPPNQTINPLPGVVALTAVATDSDTTATVTYSAGTPSTLPPGVAINATTGAITGTATTAFTGTTTLTAADGTGATAIATFTWTDANTITIANPGAQATMPGAAISMPLTYTDNGGLVPTFTAAGLPTGLGISAAGVIGGTPTAPGTYTPTITATDSTGSAGTA